MNYHSDEWIMYEVKEHYNEALKYFPKDKIIGIFYQGSGNYGLDYEDSDVDTKLVIAPSIKNLAMGTQAANETHIRANDEHIDFKDIRLYLQLFKKQNLNFLEILYTSYYIINEDYKDEWMRLVKAREEISRYSLPAAIRSMRGIAKEKYFALEHPYPSRMEWINKWHYDPKQLHHLLRLEEYIARFIFGETSEACLCSGQPTNLIEVKRGCYFLEDARCLAKMSIDHIDEMCNKYLVSCSTETNQDIDNLIDDVQYNIIKIAIAKELGELNEH